MCGGHSVADNCPDPGAEDQGAKSFFWSAIMKEPSYYFSAEVYIVWIVSVAITNQFAEAADNWTY